jgi:hypothetical protein
MCARSYQMLKDGGLRKGVVLHKEWNWTGWIFGIEKAGLPL